MFCNKGKNPVKYTLGRLRQIALSACCGLVFAAIPAKAQFLGYVSPQTVQSTLANAVACGGTSSFTVPNIGQNQHFINVTADASVTNLRANIVGSDGATTAFIGDTLFVSAGAFAVGQGAGYYPIVKVVIQCTGGTFSASYAGTSSAPPIMGGSYLQGRQMKLLFSGIPANANQTITAFIPPFEDVSGTIRFAYQAATLAGSTVTVSCTSTGASGFVAAETFSIANTASVQLFKVPPSNCPLMQVAYTSGGATAATFAMDYDFDTPGSSNVGLSNYSHITGTTATAVKATAGSATTLTIGTPAAGTVTLTDLATASCTGTPATNVVSVITALAGGAPVTLPLNLFFGNGICVKASVAMDLTVGFQ